MQKQTLDIFCTERWQESLIGHLISLCPYHKDRKKRSMIPGCVLWHCWWFHKLPRSHSIKRSKTEYTERVPLFSNDRPLCSLSMLLAWNRGHISAAKDGQIMEFDLFKANKSKIGCHCECEAQPSFLYLLNVIAFTILPKNSLNGNAFWRKSFLLCGSSILTPFCLYSVTSSLVVIKGIYLPSFLCVDLCEKNVPKWAK